MPKDSKRKYLSQKSSITKDPAETSQKRTSNFRVVTNRKPKISHSNSNAMLERLVQSEKKPDDSEEIEVKKPINEILPSENKGNIPWMHAMPPMQYLLQ